MRSSLTEIFRRTGRLTEAIALGQQTVADCTRVNGDLDRTTLLARNNLGAAYRDAGRLPEAIPLFERNLADAPRVLPPDSPLLAKIRSKVPPLYGADDTGAETDPGDEPDPGD